MQKVDHDGETAIRADRAIRDRSLGRVLDGRSPDLADPLIIHIVRGKADPNTLNGVNRIVHGLATAQASDGRNVQVWGLSHSPEDVRHDHKYPLGVFRAFGFRLRPPPEIRAAIAQLSPARTVVHFHSVLAPEFYAIAVELDARGIEWVHSPHGGYNFRSLQRNWLLKRIYFALFERRLVHGASAVLATGASELDDIRSMSPRARGVLIPNGQERQQRIEAPLGDVARPLFGFCGRLSQRHKGLDLLVDGFAEYARGGGQGTLWLIGDGEDADRLRQQVKSHGLEQRIRFKGPQFGADKTQMLCQLDCFVHTSRWEGLPMVLLDAAALGIPMIVSKETNFGEFVRADKAGIVLERNEPESIAGALWSIEQSFKAGSFNETKANARRAAQTRPDWDVISRRIHRELYRAGAPTADDASGPAAIRLQIVSAFGRFLTDQRVTWRVMGDPTVLVESTEIDFDLVADVQVSKSFGLVKQFCADNDFRLIACHEHASHGTTFYIGRRHDLGGDSVTAIDISSDVYFGSSKIIPLEEALSSPSRISVGGFSFEIPPPDVALKYYLIKRLAKREVDEVQFSYLRRLRHEGARFPAEMLRRWMSASSISTLELALATNDLTKFESTARSVSTRLGLTTFSLSGLPRIVRRLMHPTGLLVAVVGPDGAGKSTLLDAIASMRMGGAIKSVVRKHLRPQVIGTSSTNGSPVLDPHGKPAYGLPLSVAKLVLLFLDYTIGYLSTTFEPVRRSALVLYDRYFQDIYVDPLRVRYGGPRWAAKLLGAVLPKPDLMIVLDAPAEVILQRKQELSLDECVRQTNAYRRLAEGEPYARIVNAGQQPSAVAAEAEELITDFLVKRERKRFERY
jgi:glycosyltransferase involved in cell wall biosynthesis/thymidylate kinase